MKAKIAAEAYKSDASVRQIARKYDIYRKTFLCWKWTLESLPPAGNLLYKKTVHQGRRDKDQDVEKEMLKYFKERREDGGLVTIRALCLQARRLKPGLNDIPLVTLRQRIPRMLTINAIVLCRTAHIAQNTRRCEHVKLFSVNYVNGTIRCYQFPSESVVNIDQTNVDFRQTARQTLEKKSEITITIRSHGGWARFGFYLQQRSRKLTCSWTKLQCTWCDRLKRDEEKWKQKLIT